MQIKSLLSIILMSLGIIAVSYVIYVNYLVEKDYQKFIENQNKELLKDKNCWIENQTNYSTNITYEVILCNISEMKANIYVTGIVKQEMGMQTSISTSIVRPRWYGNISESGNFSNLYLFNIVNLPLQREFKDYRGMHKLFLILLSVGISLLTLIFITIKLVNKLYNGNSEEFERR